MKHGYRADIDGLRAIAVLSVVLYHLDFGIFHGGYFGVDIFFVISGFLITRIIRDELSAGTFSYLNFYERRTRRIFPSVLATLWLSLIGAGLLFAPPDLVNFANSLMSTMLFVSNVYFWQHIGYFTAAVDVKPLLHMWSLSVEEQFYFVWPFLLALLFKKTTRRISCAVIAFVFLASLAAAEYFGGVDPNGTFYLLPFRMFEFIVGGAMVWLVGHQPKHRSVNEILTLAGIAAMLFALLGQSGNLPFPSLYSLVPCIGAALVIYAGANARSRILIANRPMVYIGLISYQLYLVHWPLYVFYKYRLLSSITDADKFVLLALTFVFAIPMYHFLDKPLRRVGSRESLYNFATWMAALAVVLSLITLTIRLDKGWTWRIEERYRVLMNDPASFHRDQYGGAGFASRELQTLGAPNTKPSFIVFGDSFAAQYATGLDHLLKQNNKSALAIFQHSCVITPDVAPRNKSKIDDQCNGKWEEVAKLMIGNNLPIVVAHSWHTYNSAIADKQRNPVEFANSADYTRFMIGQIERIRQAAGADRRMILIGLAPGIGDQQGVIRCFSIPSIIPNKCASHVSMPATEMREGQEFNTAARIYASAHPNVTFLNARDVVCDAQQCWAISSGKLYYSDYIHFSIDGSVLFVNHFKDVFLGLADDSGAEPPMGPPPPEKTPNHVEPIAAPPLTAAPPIVIDETTRTPEGAVPVPIAPIPNSGMVYHPVAVEPKPGSIIVTEPTPKKAPPVQQAPAPAPVATPVEPPTPANVKTVPVAPIPGSPVVAKPIPADNTN